MFYLLRSSAINCDCLRSAICDPRSYGNQPLDRTWFYLLRSSAITIAGSQTIADLIAICDHMETSLKHDLIRRISHSKTLLPLSETSRWQKCGLKASKSTNHITSQKSSLVLPHLLGPCSYLLEGILIPPC